MSRPLVDMIGKTFNSWTVISKVLMRTSSGIMHYLCECLCGNRCTIQGSALRNGMSKSCNVCGSIDRGKKLTGRPASNRLPVGESTRNALLARYKKSAKRRGYSFELSKEYFDSIIHRPCHYCGSSDSNLANKGTRMELSYNGIDRVDNTKGYIESNTVPCCKVCNRAKDVMTLKEFSDWVARLFDHMTIQKEELYGKSIN